MHLVSQLRRIMVMMIVLLGLLAGLGIASPSRTLLSSQGGFRPLVYLSKLPPLSTATQPAHHYPHHHH